MKYYFALLFGLLVSCVSPANSAHSARGMTYSNNPAPNPGTFVIDEMPVYIDKDFSDSSRKSIQSALREWNIVLNGYALYTVQNDHMDFESLEGLKAAERVETELTGIVIVQINHMHPIVRDNTILAFVNELGGHQMFVVEDRIGGRNFQAIIEHELGHALGLEHNHARNTLMFPSYRGGVSCIDHTTVQLLATLNGWDVRRMNYCM